MIYQEYPPHPALREYINCYWTLTLPGVTQTNEVRILAEGIELSFNLADPASFVCGDASLPDQKSKCNISGPMTRPLLTRLHGPMDILGICFLPGGQYPFFHYPARELVNAVAETETLWSPKVQQLTERVCNEYGNTRERINHLNSHFLKLLYNNRKDDPVISEAVRLIKRYRGQIDMEMLSHHVGLSLRQLQRRFRERVGLSPKQLSRSYRFKSLIRQFIEADGISPVYMALECGYYDQSHMINDFRHYTGENPSSFFSKPDNLASFFTGNF